MVTSTKASIVLLLVAIALYATDPCSVHFDAKGEWVIQNSILRLNLAPYDIRKYWFKPTGHEMLNVRYGQVGHLQGIALGEVWDAVMEPGLTEGTPALSPVYVPIISGTDAERRGGVLVQQSVADYRWRRTIVCRQDYGVLEVRYELSNIKAEPRQFSLRMKSIMSPGARGELQNKIEDLYIPIQKGVLAVDQNLLPEAYFNTHKGNKFVTKKYTGYKSRRWFRGMPPTPKVTGNWLVQMNRENGDGMLMILDRASYEGVYNYGGITVEPMMSPVFLKKGTSWTFTCYLAAFSGGKGFKALAANPLFVQVDCGRLIPLFNGKLVLTANGQSKTVPASISSAVAVGIDLRSDWSAEARDRKGRLIGTLNSKGAIRLFEPKVVPSKGNQVEFKGEVYANPNDMGKIEAFVKSRDFVVYCPWRGRHEVRELAKKLALDLGVGIVCSNPKSKALFVGSVRDGLIRDVGLLERSFSKAWPGGRRGAMVHYSGLQATRSSAVMLVASHPDGVEKAVAQFRSTYMKDSRAPAGFSFWPVGPEKLVYPYARPPKKPLTKIKIDMAKGEYEGHQAVITAYEQVEKLKVTLSPLVNAKTGKQIDPKGYATPYRRRHGPAWIRWVYRFPHEAKDGSYGTPDPLLYRPVKTVAAGMSQPIWITFIMPEKMDAGLYTATLTCETDKGTKSIPVEVNVWDFAIPKNGVMMGEAYTNLKYMSPNKRRDLKRYHVERWVENMVEHGMRLIHATLPEITRLHISKEGCFKGVKADHLVVSDDGKVMLDLSKLDWFVNICDRVGRPYRLEYMLYGHSLNDYFGNQSFKRELPDRHSGKGERHWADDHYRQEIYELSWRYIKRRGWDKRFILKVSDEPKSFEFWYDQLTNGARGAGFPIYTAFNSIDWKEAITHVDKVAMWQPLYMYYDKKFMDAARKAGVRISWYNCGPPPRRSLKTSAAEIRSYCWQGAKADLDVIAWWGIQAEPGNVWDNRYSHWHSVVYGEHPRYPAYRTDRLGTVDATPLDSMRWELIRDGLEDAWYVNILREEIATMRRRGEVAQAATAENTLDRIWRTTYPDLSKYNPPYAKLLENRRAVAIEILRLKRLNEVRSSPDGSENPRR